MSQRSAELTARATHGAASTIAAPAAQAANVPGNVSMRSAPNGVSA